MSGEVATRRLVGVRAGKDLQAHDAISSVSRWRGHRRHPGRGSHYRRKSARTRSSLGVRPVLGREAGRRKQKPRSREDSHDGAAIAKIRLPFMSKDEM